MESALCEEFADPIARLAKESFGLDYLYPYQRLVAANVLDAAGCGRGPGAESLRQLVLLPTGFGKSLCFQLPALALPGPTLVAYPLLALMEDQVRRLESLGIPSALFRGGQSPEERARAEKSVERGEAKIIITNPECLGVPRLLDFLKEARPSHLAIDEAHCVSEWGESFRPAYLELGRIAEELDPPALSAFTATASPLVFEAVARILFGGSAYRVIEGDPDRPNISYAVVRSLSAEHSLMRLARELERPLLVFASSREGVQLLARLLSERLGEREVRFYHAGLEKPEKKAIETWFYSSERGILVSTCAYGMGVDKKNIRSVVHYEAPGSIEAYLQEAGRAGRDGRPSKAVLIAGPGAESRLALEKDELRRSRFAALLSYASSKAGCRREALLDLLGTPREGRQPCSGCDRCEEESRGLPPMTYAEGELEITSFVSANARRFNREEALALLRDSGSRAAKEPPCCAESGSMRSWEAKDAGRAMSEALNRGMIREGEAWPWKGMLSPKAIRPCPRRSPLPRLRAGAMAWRRRAKPGLSGAEPECAACDGRPSRRSAGPPRREARLSR
jgi:ATP-dependent DNA helicase RecQ